MKMIINNMNSIISWKHVRDFVTDKYGNRTFKTKGGCTVCCIRFPDDEHSMKSYMGIAYCSEFDVYNKSIGRKHSLTAAIANYDRTTRSNIWKMYKKECK